MKVALGSLVMEAQRVFCVGRNYAAHAAELDNPIPDSLVVFLKPAAVPGASRGHGWRCRRMATSYTTRPR